MKVSLNTIKGINERHGCTGDITAIGVDKLIEKIGAQLGGVDEVIDLGAKYKGIVIVKVVECVKHPDADKLSLCRIDDGGAVQDVERGDDGLVQVVCGAPNVRKGLFAAWLPPGSVVPETVGKDEFVLGARELRGKVSNGMLASPKELALGDSHSGIIELDEHQPGTDFAEAYGLKDDIVLDIENKMFTHRPDCFGFLGLSREMAGIQQMPFKSPDWYKINPPVPGLETNELKIELKNELPELVPHFMLQAMDNVKVGPSPAWLVVELAKVGQKSINNIVDYTNWFMLETGQPLHAYDYDKVKQHSSGDHPVIVVRHPHQGEKVKLLNGKQIEPRAEAIMIATDKELIGVGGVIGGVETEVDENTTRIILECGSFDMYSVRRTSMEHGLFTDAVTRFTKGQSPIQNQAVLARIVAEIRQHAGGKVASELVDDKHFNEDELMTKVAVTPDFVNKRLGLKLSSADIAGLLRNVEFAVLEEGDKLAVHAPFWRRDIEIAEDIVEEVGRLYGYDHLPLELPLRNITPTRRDPLFDLKATIRETLSSSGANEVLTYSFVHGDLLDKVGQDKAQAFQIANALSPDLQYYRLSLIPSLLDKVHPNIKAGYDEFALFEIGKAHSQEFISDDLPMELETTALVLSTADKLKKQGAAYYQTRTYLERLAGTELEYRPFGERAGRNSFTVFYNPDRAALVYHKDGTFLGAIGEFKTAVSRALKLPKYTAAFEVDTTVLGHVKSMDYVPLSRFPEISQDITLRVKTTHSYSAVYDFVWSQLAELRLENTSPSLSPVGIYQAEDDQEHKNVTLRLTISSYERTLTDKEVSTLLDAIAAAATDKLQAERI